MKNVTQANQNEIEERIEGYLEKMTLEEKVSLLAGASMWTTQPVDRLGIPAIKVTDGPNGARGGSSFAGGVTAACFPVGISLAATWNTDLIKEIGQALGEEAKTKGAHLLLAPTVNIHRSPLNGRNFECYSEDPFLSARLAVAYIQGVQSQGVGATVKHFVCNDSEFERNSISSEVDERALREIYLPPFKAAVQEGKTWAVMAAYNKVNGTFASENPYLLTDILRKEWGFDGLVMSDWFGTKSTAAAVNAGLDLEMPGPAAWRGDKLLQAVVDNEADLSAIDESVRRMLRTIFRAGAFENPEIPAERAVDRPEHRALIRRAAAEGIVLLKNKANLLPLDAGKSARIAIIGPNARVAQIMGGGSAQVSAHYTVTPFEGISRKVAGAAQIDYAPGCTNHKMLPKLDPGLLSDAPGGQGAGFSVSYYNNLDCSGEPVYQMASSSSEQIWFGDVAPGVDRERFSAVIAGKFRPEESGLHTFSLVSAGLSKLFIGGREVIDNWTSQTPGEAFFGQGGAEVRAEVEMRAGSSYDLRLEYSQPQASIFVGVRLGHLAPMPADALAQAAAIAAQADVALVFVGLNGEWESEGHDRPDMELVGRQVELIEAVAAANEKTVVVLQTGSPVTMHWLDKVAAVLQAWYPGQECGNAIADVLYGDVNPCGRLPETFPRRLQDNPAYLNYPGENGRVRYGEGLFVGYRYYDKKRIAPLFPFGFGLSYTSFSYGALKLDRDHVGPEEQFSASIDVTNTGGRAGQEVVQLYVHDRESRLARPDKELKGFQKVSLRPGETKKVTFNLDRDAFAYWDDAAAAWVAEAGDYVLLAGSSAGHIRATAPITLTETARFGGPPKVRRALGVDSMIRELLNDPEALAVLEEHLPGFSTSPQLGMAAGMTVSQVASLVPDRIPEKALRAIAAELGAIFPEEGADVADSTGAEAGHFTLDTTMEELLADAGAKAVLEQHFPGIVENPQLQMALGMSLSQIAPFAADIFTEEKLAEVAADLAGLE